MAAELELDVSRLWIRNLGRDDRRARGKHRPAGFLLAGCFARSVPCALFIWSRLRLPVVFRFRTGWWRIDRARRASLSSTKGSCGSSAACRCGTSPIFPSRQAPVTRRGRGGGKHALTTIPCGVRAAASERALSALPCTLQALLREVSRALSLPESASRVKRAIQFGSALAKLSNVAEFGSNRKANAASAGSVKIGERGSQDKRPAGQQQQRAGGEEQHE